MRINHLHVRNFKGFEDRHFDFPRSADAPGSNGSFHLLIGRNATGKTSALDALAVAAGAWFLGVPEAVSRTIRGEDIRVKVIDFGDTQRIERQLPVIVTVKGEAMGKSIHWQRILAWSRTDTAGAKSLKRVAKRVVAAVREGRRETLPLIVYYGTGRSWQEPRSPVRPKMTRAEIAAIRTSMMKNRKPAGSNGQLATALPDPPQPVNEDDEPDDLADDFASSLAGYRDSLDPRCSPRQLLRWLKFEQQLAVQDRRESIQFQVVKDAIRQSVAGCISVNYHLRLGLLLDIEGQQRLPFSALSHGQRNMVAMIGDMAYRAAQLNPHLGAEVLAKTPGIVLIDELELHLHPRWQRRVVQDLQGLFPEVQFFASTHSPQIVGHLPPRWLHLLQRDQAGQIVQVPVSQSLGMDSNWILEQIMDTPERESATGDRLSAVFDVIDEGDYTKARARIRDIEDQVGLFPELQGAKSMLDRLEMLAGDEKDR